MTATQVQKDEGSGNTCEQDLAPVSGGAAAAAPPDTGLMMKSTVGPDAGTGVVADAKTISAGDPA